jgi:hypothetical protein
MGQSPWLKKARRKLGQGAMHIGGDGRFAFVTPCRDPTFVLCRTMEEAEKKKTSIDTIGCSGSCYPKSHYIVDLEDEDSLPSRAL